METLQGYEATLVELQVAHSMLARDGMFTELGACEGGVDIGEGRNAGAHVAL